MNEPAFGYLDPATGSYIVQVIIGIFVSLLFAIKIYWKKLKEYFNLDNDEPFNHPRDKDK
jgi:hypothetical protein